MPGLQEFDPNVRWWSNLTGFTDVQSLLSPETSRTLIANLQGLDVTERAKVTTSLLAFVGLFIAELMKVINDAEHGDRVELLQVWMQADAFSLMQQPVLGPGTFAKALSDLQAGLELQGKSSAAGVAKHLQGKLNNLGQAGGKRARDRMERLQALLVTFENEGAIDGDMGAEDVSGLWTDLCPFLTDVRTGPSSSSARPTSTAAGVIDSDDEREGILVKRKPGEDWKTATKEETEELRQHDRQVREQEREQAREDEAMHSSMEATRAQEWEDWAMYSEMQSVQQVAKRVRARVTLSTQRGTILAEHTLEGEVPATDEVMVQFALKESTITRGVTSEHGAADMPAPSTPSTVPLSESAPAPPSSGKQDERRRPGHFHELGKWSRPLRQVEEWESQ